MRLLLICLLLLNLLALAAGFGLLGSSAPRGESERLTNQINPERLQLNPVAPEPMPNAAATRSAAAAVESAQSVAMTTPLSGSSASQTLPDAIALTPPPAGSTADAEVLDIASTDDEPPPLDGVPLACLAYAGLTEVQRDTIVSDAESVDPTLRLSSELIDPPGSWWVRIPPSGSRAAADERARQLRAQGITDLFVVRDNGPSQYAISLGLFRTEASARQHLADLQARQVRGAEIAARNPASFAIEITGTAVAIQRLEARLAERNLTVQAGACAP